MPGSDEPPLPERVREALREMARRRGSSATFCPSEVARQLADDWRPLMPQVREAAALLVDAGELRATQRGQVVDPRTARGPIRLRQAEAEPGSGEGRSR